MRVLVLRAEADGLRTGAALARAGHQAVLAPLQTIVAAPVADLSAPVPDFILATSRHALLAPVPTGWLARSCFAVGQATARAATDLGFANVIAGPGHAQGLIRLVKSRCPPPTRGLYLAGEPRRPEIERELGAAGYAIAVLLRYRVEPVRDLPPTAIAALAAEECAAVFHYSGLAAARFIQLASAAGLQGAVRQCVHVTLSARVAAALQAAANTCGGRLRVLVAARPDEAAMIDGLAPLFIER